MNYHINSSAMEQAKLKKFSYLGSKNYGVFGKKNLPEILEGAMSEYQGYSTQDLWQFRFDRGHGVQSSYG